MLRNAMQAFGIVDTARAAAKHLYNVGKEKMPDRKDSSKKHATRV